MMTKRVEQYIMEHTAQECIKRFSRNMSLIDNLAQVFDHLCQNMKMLFQCDKAMHVFINCSLPEVDVLFAQENKLENEALGFIEYKRLNFESHDDYKKLLQISGSSERINEFFDVPEFIRINPEILFELLGLLESPETSTTENSTDSGLIVPFDISGLNLGFFVLWKEHNHSIEMVQKTRLRGWIASIYYFLVEFFNREYLIVSENTYLPSLYAARWNRVAVLFADIMNFTPLTENLKVKYGQQNNQETKVFRDILNEHFKEVAIIIQGDGQGRIDNFLSTRVMALFGEHEDNPTKAAGNAVYAATLLVERFEVLKEEFLIRAFGKGYETEYNESVDIKLRVGIDYGQVLFEYLGDDRHREYTAIGDHVTFSQFLEHQALRYDDSGIQYPPILISQTIERCTRPFIEPMNKKPIKLYESEKGQVYQVYGLNEKSFIKKYFFKCRNENSWKNAWKSEDSSMPE